MDKIEEWVDDQDLGIDIDNINSHNVFDDCWRVDVYTKETGHFVPKLSISKSYLLRVDESGVVFDITT